MLKYASIKGFTALGEVGFLSHLYYWREEKKETPMVILVHAYDGSPSVFKGFIFNETKEYKPVDVLPNELTELENILGDIKVADFKEVIKGTYLDNDFYNNFVLMP